MLRGSCVSRDGLPFLARANHIWRRVRYRRLLGKLRSNKFVSITARPEFLLDGQLIKVVFGATGRVKDILIRVWGADHVILVRAKADGTFPKGAISAVSRLPNARFIFFETHQMRSVVASRPALKTAARLILRSPLGLMSDDRALLALRAQTFAGETDVELVTEPPSIADITLWFGYPVGQSKSFSEQADIILHLDVPYVTERDWAQTASRLEEKFPGAPIKRLGSFLAIDSEEVTRTFFEITSRQCSIITTHDVPTAAYLHHLGYRVVFIKADGELSVPSNATAEGMAMLGQFAATALYDIRMRRSVSLAAFVSHEAGEFRRHQMLLREINRAVVQSEDKLELLAVARARQTDPLLAAELQLLLERLAETAKDSSAASFAFIQRLMHRLNQTGVIAHDLGEANASLFLHHLKDKHAPPSITLSEKRPLQKMSGHLRKALTQMSLRWFFGLGRIGILTPLSRLAARQIAKLGIERGFQFVVGMTRSRVAAISLARKIEMSSSNTDAHASLICARLYLSADATEDGLRVLQSCQSFGDAQQGTIISCLHTTGHVEEALAWYRDLADEVKFRPHVAVNVTRLLLRTGTRSNALSYLRDCEARDPRLSQSQQAMLAELLVFEGEIDEACSRFSDLVEQGSDDPRVLLKWASTMRLTGSSKAGIRYLQHPRLSEVSRAWLLLSYLLAEEGDLMGALKAALAGFDIKQSSSVLIARLALLASVASADDLIDDALSRHAAVSAAAKINAANLMISRRKYDDAARLLDEAEAAKADRLKIAQTRLKLYQHTEEHQLARTVLETVLDIDPSRLNFVLAAGNLALELNAVADVRGYVELASLISAKDHRVLELNARLSEYERDYGQAMHLVGIACRERRANSLTDDLRSNWRHFRLCAAAGDREEARAAFGRLVSGLHQLLPPEVVPWKGTDLSDQRVLLLPRGGPGDELRALQVVGRRLSQKGTTMGFLGDARMREIFHLNFPKGEFIENPIAGSKLRSEQISQVNLPRLQPGSIEMARRLGIFVRANVFERFEQVIYADDGVLQTVLPDVLSSIEPCDDPLQLPSDAHARAEEVLHNLEGEGPVVTISWRGSYFSPNRPSSAFLQISELGPILRNQGVRFLDTHPNSSDKERAEIEQRYGVRILRPKGENFRDDLGLLGAIMCKARANIVPPVTQRDLAAAVGAPNIWSFDVIPGISEAWRVNPKTQSDLWQPHILHHTERHYGSRAEVVAALARKVAAL